VGGAAVTVGGGGPGEELVAASGRVVTRLTELEFILGEGPGHDAYRTGHPITETALAAPHADARWPGFAREATAAGAQAILAVPLKVGELIIGMLFLYRQDRGGFTGPGLDLAPSLARAGAEMVLRDFDTIDVLTDGGAWPGRPEIPQATGMIAVQRNITVSAALAVLRAAAYAQNRSITELAADVINRRITFAAAAEPGR
jgi:hypothetical protein